MLPLCSVVQTGQLLSGYAIYMWTFGLRTVKPRLQVCWQSEGNSLGPGSETRMVGRGGLCEMQTSRSELSWRCILASDMWTAVKTGWSTIIPYVELNLQFQLPRGNCFQLEVILQGKKKRSFTQYCERNPRLYEEHQSVCFHLLWGLCTVQPHLAEASAWIISCHFLQIKLLWIRI